MVREKLAAAQRPDAYEGRYAGYRGAISNGKPRDICVLQPPSRAGEFLFFFSITLLRIRPKVLDACRSAQFADQLKAGPISACYIGFSADEPSLLRSAQHMQKRILVLNIPISV
jgi:hypothetical protein